MRSGLLRGDGSSGDIQGLLGMDPMVQDASGGWYDGVAASAVNDFYRILLTNMDPDLRATFTCAAPLALAPEVQRITEDNAEETAAFYKDLQVPYLIAVLAGTSQPGAKHLNGAAARKQLEQLCAKSPVYRRQAQALHALHWKKKWPALSAYLEDQRTGEHSREILAAFDRLQVQLRSLKELAPGSERAPRFDALLSRLGGLKEWALTRKLHWAARLYAHLATEWMPRLRGALTEPHRVPEVTREIRSYSALFAILEETDRNPAGLTFHDAFMETVRAFTSADTMPRYEDYRGNPEHFSEAIDGLFTEFKKRYTHSGVPEIEQALQQWSRPPVVS